MEERDAEACAGRTQGIAAVGGAVVEVKDIGWSMAAQSTYEDREHVDLALGVMGIESYDVARGVVDQPVDSNGQDLAVCLDRGSVADIAPCHRAPGRSACQQSRILFPSRAWRRSRPCSR